LRKTKRLTLFLFLLPWIATFAIFTVYPLVFSVVVSFTDYSGLNPKMSYVGIKNYARAFSDPVFIKALANTFSFVLVTVPATTIISFCLALLLTSGIRLKRLFQAGFFLPSVISMVVISMIWLYIFSATGPLNLLLSSIGLKVSMQS